MSITYELVKFFSYMLLGLVVAFIAYQRLVTARNKLKLDLYNKRFSIYADTLEFYQELVAGHPSAKARKKFMISKESSYHLFSNNREIYKLLDRMNSESLKITDYKNRDNEMEGSPKDKMDMSQDSINTIKWFNQQIPSLRDMMSEYLDQ